MGRLKGAGGGEKKKEPLGLRRQALLSGNSASVLVVQWSTCGRFLMSNSKDLQLLCWSTSGKGRRAFERDLVEVEWFTQPGEHGAEIHKKHEDWEAPLSWQLSMGWPAAGLWPVLPQAGSGCQQDPRKPARGGSGGAAAASASSALEQAGTA